jgi:ankyrin repeat protein
MISPEILNMPDACRRRDVEQVANMIDANRSLVNTEDHKGFTPLIIAVYNNQQEVVKLLLRKGARADMQGFSGNTALMGVAFKGYTELAANLLDAGRRKQAEWTGR